MFLAPAEDISNVRQERRQAMSSRSLLPPPRALHSSSVTDFTCAHSGFEPSFTFRSMYSFQVCSSVGCIHRTMRPSPQSALGCCPHPEQPHTIRSCSPWPQWPPGHRQPSTGWPVPDISCKRMTRRVVFCSGVLHGAPASGLFRVAARASTVLLFIARKLAFCGKSACSPFRDGPPFSHHG